MAGSSRWALKFYNTPKQTERQALPSKGEGNAFDQLRQDHFSMSPPSSDGGLSATLPPNSSANQADQKLEVIIYYKPEHTAVIGDYDFYVNMLAIIVLASQGPTTATIDHDYGLSVAGFHGQIAVTGPKDTPKPFSRPPLFRWHDLFSALRITSQKLRKRRYFKSIRVKLQIEKVEIGNIYLDPWKEDPRGGSKGGVTKRGPLLT